eukprot:CAMPEP_0173321576 /NCGR_PEP_ID=MMETSP1143-20121109/29483_1 /TAXON_ID=483371 /ORGANISM="non described non described, Strain CCMP2298" /LENGTH=146 /DNA_ID=CAMNT_0014265335 /DNA_START=553 /DNA_END=993 /DNA_ORIENTATION=-
MAKKSPFDPPLPESPAKISTMAPMLTTAQIIVRRGRTSPSSRRLSRADIMGLEAWITSTLAAAVCWKARVMNRLVIPRVSPVPLEFAHYVAPTGHADAHQRGYAEDRVTVEDDCEVRNAVDFAQQQRIGRQRQDTKDGEEGAFDSI